MKKPIACLLLLLLVSFAMADMMPDFKLPDATGKNVILQELLGKGPVLIDFWADYCKPCKDVMPQLNTLAEKYDSLTVVMISIDAPKNLPKAKNYLKSKNYKFITLFDSEKTLAKKLGVTNPPHTFILNKTGEIVYSHIGYEPGVENEYEMHIRNLLGLETEAE
ncbi:MAG: TlpA disulfide reductase family protein [Candidatus Cloacimonas acidaminovorans]|nr:TlpA disulfide reductase family protein [Candidatus Cloacimonas acidaminovorans]